MTYKICDRHSTNAKNSSRNKKKKKEHQSYSKVIWWLCGMKLLGFRRKRQQQQQSQPNKKAFWLNYMRIFSDCLAWVCGAFMFVCLSLHIILSIDSTIAGTERWWVKWFLRCRIESRHRKQFFSQERERVRGGKSEKNNAKILNVLRNLDAFNAVVDFMLCGFYAPCNSSPVSPIFSCLVSLAYACVCFNAFRSIPFVI